MNLKASLSLVLIMSMHVTDMNAAITLQDVSSSIENGVIDVARFIDSIGAYFNLCRLPVTQAVPAALKETGEHLINLNAGAALNTARTSGQQMFDMSLPEAPVATFFKEYMRETKAILGVLAVIATYVVV